MKESTIVKKIMDYLRTLPECFFWKEHGGQFGVAGIPDIICCYKSKFIAIEVKTPDGRLTKLQEVTIHRINKAGGIAFVATSVENVKKVMEDILKNDTSE